MSKIEREAERRVALPKLGGKGAKGSARAKYWAMHEKPEKKKQQGTGLEYRLRRDDASLLQRINDLGSKSDAVVAREKPESLVRNLAFKEHQAKLRGAIARLAKVQRGGSFARDQVAAVMGVYTMARGDWPSALPKRVEVLAMKTAFITLEGRGKS
jgi:hypothetical protein